MTTDVDALILASTGNHWRKVAMVVVQVGERASDTVVDDETVAARIRSLVAAGHLESKGDLSQWRFSEVRRSNVSCEPKF